MFRQLSSSLIFKTALLFAVAALVPFVLAATFLVRSARNALYSEVVRGLHARVELMRDALDARLVALRGNAIAWAGLEVMTDLLADDLDKRITVVLEGLKRDYALDGDLHVLAADGRVVASSVEAAIGRTLDEPSLLGLARGTTRARGAATSRIDGQPAVGFAVPITSRALGDKVIGTLLLEYHLADLERSVLSGTVSMAAIIDQGRIVAATDRWVPELEQVRGDRSEFGPFVVASASQKGGPAFSGFGWVVIGAAERDVVLAPVIRVERLSLAGGLAGVALLVLLVAAAASRGVRPLLAVSNAADQISRTLVLSHRVPADRADEIGQMGRAFNRMVDEVNRHVDMLLQANIQMLEVLGSAIAKRDSDTSAHNYRVTLLALALAEDAGLQRPALQAMVKGSFLHDVGKIGITDAILLKPGRLDAAEFAIMKSHVLHGTDIVRGYGWLQDALAVVRSHHERVDGSGYPDGLVGDAIPLNARIFALADVFDALTSERPYKAALSCGDAIDVMARDRGRHFDPELFDRFERLAPNLYERICVADVSDLERTLRSRMRAYLFGGSDGYPPEITSRMVKSGST